jgi:hypothetical protein
LRASRMGWKGCCSGCRGEGGSERVLKTNLTP